MRTSNPDENYAKTRSFYSSIGIKPLEKKINIGDENKPCIIFVKCIYN